MAIPADKQHVTYQFQYRKCGKSSCSTCRNGQGHGPYWYAYWREGTRLRSGYVGKVNPYQPIESNQELDEATVREVSITGMTSSSQQRHGNEARKAHRGKPFEVTSLPA